MRHGQNIIEHADLQLSVNINGVTFGNAYIAVSAGENVQK